MRILQIINNIRKKNSVILLNLYMENIGKVDTF